jgi:hypothetical protein
VHMLSCPGDSIATKKMDELARGGLDAVAKARGITNRADDDGKLHTVNAAPWWLGSCSARSFVICF